MRFSISHEEMVPRHMDQKVFNDQHRRALEIYLLLEPKLREFPEADVVIASWRTGIIRFRIVFKFEERVEAESTIYNSEDPAERATQVLYDVVTAISRHAHEKKNRAEQLRRRAEKLHKALAA